MNEYPNTRRDFVKKAAYVAPAIVSFAATPAFAKSGSEKDDKDRDDGGKNHKPTKSAWPEPLPR